jgi:hypothetical protein
MGFAPYKINVDKLANILGIPADKLKDAVEQCKVGGYAKVWRYEDNGKSGKAQISVAKKHTNGSFTVGKVTNGYETTFTGNVTVAGDAWKKLKNATIPKGGLTVRISSCDVTTRNVNEKWFTNFTIFGLEIAGQVNENKADDFKSSNDNEEDNGLPF